MSKHSLSTRTGPALAALLAGLLAFPAPAPASPAPPSAPAAEPSVKPSAARVTPPQRTSRQPKATKDVDILDHRGKFIPTDLVFKDSTGKAVKLGDVIDGDKPVVLVFAYFTCPMLCSMIQNGVVESVRGMGWTAGEDFQAITVSIDPSDTPADAAKKKKSALARLGTPEAADGWRFLVDEGQGAMVRKLADVAGFQYNYLPERQQYAHAAGILVLTPKGKIARYLYGVRYPPQTLRLSLVEASDGQVGSALDKILLCCFQYNADEGKYTATAKTVMTLGGAVTLTALVGVLSMAFYFERRRGGPPGEDRDKGVENPARPGHPGSPPADDPTA